MKSYLFIPSLPRMTGGLAVISRLADVLSKNAHPVVLTVSGPLPPNFEAFGLPCENLADAKPAKNDIWLVPEGFPNALAPGLRCNAHCVVYVQNWAYMLSSLPENVNWRQLPVDFLAVSQPVSWYVRWLTGRHAPILRPGLDSSLFYPAPDQAERLKKGLPPGNAIRIAWMPRKNRAYAQQIRALFEARLAQSLPGLQTEWVELHRLEQAEVAEQLRACHIFLATGFPEGFALPPLEAMACGVIPVGFSGMGGWDYMRQAHDSGFTPWWDMSDALPLPANGFYAADADIWAAALCLEDAARLVHKGGDRAEALFRAGQATVKYFSAAHFEERVKEVWELCLKAESAELCRTARDCTELY